MSRILISAFSNLGFSNQKLHDTFVVGLMNALKRTGNHILSVRCNDFIHEEHATLKKHALKNRVLQVVKDFSPDLIITFNHLFPCQEFIEETNCPIFIYPADGYDFFNFKQMIDQHLERYFFLYLNEDNHKTYTNNIACLKKEQLCHFSYATDFKSLDIPQDIKLSFLGSISTRQELGCYFFHLPFYQAAENNKIKENFFAELDRFKNEPHSNFDCDLPDFYKQYNTSVSLESLAVFLITNKQRFEILSGLTDLGLSIYGLNSFCIPAIYNYDILRAYNYEKYLSFKQVESLYNRSKISLNLPNARAIHGCSWRVPDVLATNSVLLTPFAKDLANLMQGYIDLPMYRSVAEARDLAGKLLKDDIWRREISEASQQMIEDKCRFEPNFKTMEEASGVKLHSDEDGSIEDLYSILNSLPYDPEGQAVEKAGVAADECYSLDASFDLMLPAKRLSFIPRLKKEIIKALPYCIAKKWLP